MRALCVRWARARAVHARMSSTPLLFLLLCPSMPKHHSLFAVCDRPAIPSPQPCLPLCTPQALEEQLRSSGGSRTKEQLDRDLSEYLQENEARAGQDLA